jgi:membrane protease YdiL (CAAX protease family)
MWQILKTELEHFYGVIKPLDRKVITVFLSSIILLTISWYFANPKFYRESVAFLNSENLMTEEFKSYVYWFTLDIILFFIIPVYIIKYLFSEDLRNYGIYFGKKKSGLLYAVFTLLLFVPVLHFLTVSEDFSQYFPLMQNAKDDLIVFLIYEILFILFIFSWEFIFRGFILFGLEKHFGFYAVFIQMIPFVLLHTGKPFLETFSAIFGGLFLGYLALRTRSIFYGFLIHAAILVLLDFISLLGN